METERRLERSGFRHTSSLLTMKLSLLVRRLLCVRRLWRGKPQHPGDFFILSGQHFIMGFYEAAEDADNPRSHVTWRRASRLCGRTRRFAETYLVVELFGRGADFAAAQKHDSWDVRWGSRHCAGGPRWEELRALQCEKPKRNLQGAEYYETAWSIFSAKWFGLFRNNSACIRDKRILVKDEMFKFVVRLRWNSVQDMFASVTRPFITSKDPSLRRTSRSV